MEIDIDFMKEQIPLFVDSALLTLKSHASPYIISLFIAEYKWFNSILSNSYYT